MSCYMPIPYIYEFGLHAPSIVHLLKNSYRKICGHDISLWKNEMYSCDLSSPKNVCPYTVAPCIYGFAVRERLPRHQMKTRYGMS